MAELTTFEVEFIEEELFDINFIETEMVDIGLTTIDVIPRKTYIWELEDLNINNIQNKQVLIYNETQAYWENKYLADLIILNETPTNVNPLPSKRFQTVNQYLSGTLRVFLNGQKIHSSEITIISTTQFEFPIDIITSDKVEVNYIKL